MKLLLVALAAFLCASCTTLENRRDLYRSPAEGYEEKFPYPPPTRLPNSGPMRNAAASNEAAPTQTHGVITFPEEPTLPEGH